MCESLFTAPAWLGVGVTPSPITSSNNSGEPHSPMDARELLYGMPIAVIIKTCAVSIHTARRWKRTGRVPGPAVRLLELVARGELGVLNPAWLGFKLIGIRELERRLSIPEQRKLPLP